MEPRGKGRGYARGRGQPQQQQQQHPARAGPGGDQRPQSQAWVRPQQQPPPMMAWPRPQMGAGPQQPPAQQMVGRGSREQETSGAISKKVSGEGATGNQGGSGELRGATSIRGRVGLKTRDILFTKPEGFQTKKGTAGSPINLYANYLPLLQKGKWCLYQYRVDFNPDIDVIRTRKQLVRDATREMIQGGYLFDGTVLYTPNRLPNEPVELIVRNEEENVRVSIKLVGDVTWGDHHYIQLFNIIVRKCLYLMGMKLVGRNYYLPDNKIVISEHKIQLWPGYFTSMRQYEHDILLNVDLQFKFMRTDNVYDLMLESQNRRDFQTKIIGGVVLTFYNNKTYKIDDVDFSTTVEHTFKMKDGSEISYREYYKKKYSVDITVRDQPMLISRSKDRDIRAGMPETVYLVPQLCQLTGLTDKQRDNFLLMKTLASHTRIGVEGRIAKLREFARQIHSRPEVVQEIRRWDLGIAEDLIKIQGRVLPQETILAGADSKFSAGAEADWTRDLRSKPPMHGAKMERLAVICPSKFRSQTGEFLQILSKTAGGMRWSVGNPKIFEIQQDRPGNYVDEIEKIISSAHPTLIMCVLPNNAGDRYAAIKKKCYVDRGVPCQVIVARNLSSKGVMSIATKVAIQLNCKIGGAPWSVMVPLSGLMVVGYDVCRDTVQKRKSFAGMVASMDRQMTRYFQKTFEHSMEQEISENFATFLIAACVQYKHLNNAFPERILIYRDGVGDGQLPYVYDQEINIIRTKLKQNIFKETDLKMAYIIVSKRINTRIFQPRDNPPPGTVVDDIITLPQHYDFFLVSQCVRQGTVSPTRYNIIADTLGLNADRIQILTQKMTHLYYNWSGTVRVPAPCQYAHKLAFLTSQSLHRPAHKDLDLLLYYL